MIRKVLAISVLIASAVWLVGCKDGALQPTLSSPFPSRADGDEYTILLHTFAGEDHIRRAKDYKQSTEKYAKWKEVYVVHKDGRSELYRGRYRSVEAARKDLTQARTWRTPVDVQVFAQAMTVPRPGQQLGPAQWNLTNAPGRYSVVVAIFYDVPKANYLGRKRYAVKYCRQLRQRGEQAYYHHGPAQSTVTVGAFGDDAVVMVEEDGKLSPQIRDPRIEEIEKRFEFLAVNGRKERRAVINPKTGKAERVWVKPYPVHIPREKGDSGAKPFNSLGQP